VQMEPERTNRLHRRDAWMHGLLQWRNLGRGLVRVQATPVLEQLGLM
jgi:hypothetical protein